MERVKQEAECPECEEWSEVEWTDEVPPGGFWWKNSSGCPKCGYIALVETECNFRFCGQGVVSISEG